MSEENKDMVRRLMEAINKGDLDVVDELFTPKLATPMKRSFTRFRTAFPDWRMEIAELVAEGNTVVGRFRCSGTNQGEYKGVPPTGKRMEVDEVYFLQVRREVRELLGVRGRPVKAEAARASAFAGVGPGGFQE